MPVNNPYLQYKKTQIDTADQGKLVVLLYDGAIKFLNKAVEIMGKEKMTGADIEIVHVNIIKTQDILSELIGSLNMEIGDISKRLFSIYMYLNNRLIEGNIKKTKEPVMEVLKHLQELREAWAVASKNTQEQNKEKVSQNGGGINVAT